MKLRIFQLIILVLLLHSCSDYFDVSPKSQVKAEDLFQDEAGFNQALLGAYTYMSTTRLYGDNLSYGFLDVLAQYYPSIKADTNHNFFNASEFNYDEVSVESRIYNIWAIHYSAISNLNSILLYIDDNQAVFSEGAYEVLKGETMALRGYLHFSLLRLFAQAPVLGVSAQGIPYMDEFTNEAKVPLSIGEVLERIKQDLKTGRELMSENDPFGPNYKDINYAIVPDVLKGREYRMNYFAATAALSIVSFYEKDDINALSYAQEIIGTADGSQPMVELFEFANITSDKIARSETIFGLNVSRIEAYQNLYFSEDAFEDNQGRNLLAISNSIIELVYTAVGAGSIETRGEAFFGPDMGGNRALAKYQNLNASTAMIPIIKISELFLIAAETEPDINNALSYFNTFTSYRGLEAQVGLTREQLDVEIYKEYKKEFIGEGKLFLYYKRNNFDVIGIQDGVQIDKESYVLPIPASEIEFGNF